MVCIAITWSFHMDRRTLQMPEDLAERVKRMAEVERRSINNMIAVLLNEALDNRDIAGGAPWRG
jgi:hypothetical protein